MPAQIKAVITGDITQIDLPRERTSGLIETKNILQGIEGIRFVFFGKQDVVRHRLVRDIIRASGEGSRFQRFREAYGRTLDWTLNQRKWVVLIVTAAIALLMLGIGGFRTARGGLVDTQALCRAFHSLRRRKRMPSSPAVTVFASTSL